MTSSEYYSLGVGNLASDRMIFYWYCVLVLSAPASRLPDWSNLILCRCFSPLCFLFSSWESGMPRFFSFWLVKQDGYWSLETRKTIELVVWASGLNQISSWTPITVCRKLRRDHNSEMTDDSCWIKHRYCRWTRPKSVRLKTPYSIKTKIIDSIYEVYVLYK